jgi:hypothetical protein
LVIKSFSPIHHYHATLISVSSCMEKSNSEPLTLLLSMLNILSVSENDLSAVKHALVFQSVFVNHVHCVGGISTRNGFHTY